MLRINSIVRALGALFGRAMRRTSRFKKRSRARESWADRYYPTGPTRSTAMVLRDVFVEQMGILDISPSDSVYELTEMCLDDLLAEIEDEFGVTLPRREELFKNPTFENILASVIAAQSKH